MSYAISKDLFTKIIHIVRDDGKFEYINPNGAIFIDNSFHERKDIFNRYNIPVFDVDTVEALLDWRY